MFHLSDIAFSVKTQGKLFNRVVRNLELCVNKYELQKNDSRIEIDTEHWQKDRELEMSE